MSKPNAMVTRKGKRVYTAVQDWASRQWTTLVSEYASDDEARVKAETEANKLEQYGFVVDRLLEVQGE